MTPEAKKALYKQVSQPFPEEAIERTDGRQTGKGFSTTGIKAQFIINRLNEALGIGGWRTHRTITMKELTTNSGRKAYEGVCDLVPELGRMSRWHLHPVCRGAGRRRPHLGVRGRRQEGLVQQRPEEGGSGIRRGLAGLRRHHRRRQRADSGAGPARGLEPEAPAAGQARDAAAAGLDGAPAAEHRVKLDGPSIRPSTFGSLNSTGLRFRNLPAGVLGSPSSSPGPRGSAPSEPVRRKGP
jgi:hypothetical protein